MPVVSHLANVQALPPMPTLCQCQCRWQECTIWSTLNEAVHAACSEVAARPPKPFKATDRKVFTSKAATSVSFKNSASKAIELIASAKHVPEGAAHGL